MNDIDKIAELITDDPDILNEQMSDAGKLEPEIRSLTGWAKAKGDEREYARVGEKEQVGQKGKVQLKLSPEEYDNYIVHTHPRGDMAGTGMNILPSEQDLYTLAQALEIGYKGMAIFSGNDVLQLSPSKRWKGIDSNMINMYMKAVSAGDFERAKEVLARQLGLDVQSKVEQYAQ